MARPLRDRLKFDLTRNRSELLKAVTGIEDLSYAPAEGMKSYWHQLVEIGAMEAESTALLTTGKVPEWKELYGSVKGKTLGELLESLAAIRGELFDCLDSFSDSELDEPIQVPSEWEMFMGDTSLERQELFRWLARHEYYHLGQIVAFRWIKGFDPYK